MTIACYCRFSPRPEAKADGDGKACDSIRVQEDRINGWLAAHGHAAAEKTWYIDRLVSARATPLAERPEGGRLAKGVSAAEHKLVVVAALDRLFRNTIDGLSTLAAWQEAGVELAICDGVVLDLKTADGYFVATLLLGVAQREPHKTAERTSASHRAKQHNGIRTGRYPRYGYQFDPDGGVNPETGLLCREIEREDEQLVCREIAALGASGLDASTIAETLEAKGCRNRSNQRWRADEISRILKRGMP